MTIVPTKAQPRLRDALIQMGTDAFFRQLTPKEQALLPFLWRDIWARDSQLEPPGDWLTWLLLAGRGWGKTKTGGEWIAERVNDGKARRIALVGRTPADVRDVMIEGESGILACYPINERPEYEPSKRRMTWKNGAIAHTFTSYEPDQLRGPQFDTAWSDELAAWKYVRETWDNLQLGLRLGKPRQVITTTPRPISIIKELMKLQSTVVTYGTTYDNLENLAPNFRAQILARYEGTTLGRQELEGQLLDDLPGALWKRKDIRYREPTDLIRIMVAIDPAVSSKEDSDETGIIVGGINANKKGFVLADGSLRASPEQWASKAIMLYRQFNADLIVAEKNQGGDLVASTLRTVDPNVPVKLVNASKGKHTRAQPISSLYEQERVYHCKQFQELEDQMCTWLQDDEKSPDRMDAMVWLFTELMLGQQSWIVP